MKRIRFIVIFMMMQHVGLAQTAVIDLYKNVPGSKKSETYTEIVTEARTAKVTNPQLFLYQPSNNKINGTAVIICPGGGYSGLAIQKEGHLIAQKFIEQGVTAFVLKYRLPSDEIMDDRKTGPLQDAQQAMKLVRENAAKYNVNPNKIGIMGFSAGGHLASTASTLFNQVVIENKLGTSLRPDFSILVYPVITFGEGTHRGSKEKLIGANASQDLIDLYSAEKQVSKETPVTFIIHANDDKGVPVDNSLNYIKALNKYGVKNEAHIYPSGGHGFGLYNATTKDFWFDRLVNWMSGNSLL